MIRSCSAAPSGGSGPVNRARERRTRDGQGLMPAGEEGSGLRCRRQCRRAKQLALA
jgi:hypothetical protein